VNRLEEGITQVADRIVNVLNALPNGPDYDYVYYVWLANLLERYKLFLPSLISEASLCRLLEFESVGDFSNPNLNSRQSSILGWIYDNEIQFRRSPEPCPY
jgi:hypothetical protein